MPHAPKTPMPRGMPPHANGIERLHPDLQEQLQHARSDQERIAIAAEFAWERCYEVPHDALQALSYAQPLAETLKDAYGLALCLRARAALNFFTGDATEALEAAQKALQVFEERKDLVGKVTTLLTLGGIWLRLAELDRAYECFAHALALCEEGLREQPENDRLQKNWAAAYGNVGNVYIALGSIDEGMRHLLEAYRRQIELQDRRGLGITSIGIAGAYLQLGRREEAAKFLAQACELLRETETWYMLAVALSNRGHLAALEHRWEEAQQYLEESLALRQKLKDKRGEAVTLSTLAIVRFHRGQVLDAIHELRDVLRNFQQLRDINLEVKLRRELGDIHIAINDVGLALQHYHIGLELARQHHMLPWEMEFTRIFARFYEERENYAEALEYYKQYWALYERFLGRRRQQAIAIVEKRLELEQLRYERELLRLRNEELAQLLAEVERQRAETERAYAEYRRAVEERLNLSAILSHELRNLVSGVMTNAELILYGFDRLERSALIQAAETILRASEHLRDELQLLSRSQVLEVEGTKLYFQKENLLELLRNVIHYHRRESEEKQIEVLIDSEEDPFIVPLDWKHTYEIFSNYLLNAIKYSPKKSRIWIRVRRTTDGGARVAFEDQGVGIPATELPRLFKRLGRARNVYPTAGEPSIGLGLYIVKWLANRMRYRVWCESCPSKGSIFYVQIPFRASEGPYFDSDPEPEEWKHLRADYPTLEEGERGYRPRPGWVAYFPDEDRLLASDEAESGEGRPDGAASEDG